MNRRQLLAAETFRYSYANYADHLGIGNIRFDKLMPQDIDILEQADSEGWDKGKLAKALDRDEEQAAILMENYQQAKDIIDAPNRAESFRRSVRYSVKYALKEGLKTDEDIDKLVVQLCYRVADLAYLLDLEEEKLSDYSEELRKDTGD
ncbi:MAG: hypothetical protein C4538_09030 [Nitrospiraceae bacterium]|nr:MAG: hypothetical protein C4538_09030 [Nitrospiraceae bacterium]